MCTLDKITELLKQQKKKQKDLTDFLGLTKNTYTNWKAGDNESYKKYIDKIAEFFDVSTDYLLGVEKTSAENSEGNTSTYKVVAMGGFAPGKTVVDNNQIDKLTELLEAARDLPPEKIEKLIKMVDIL